MKIKTIYHVKRVFLDGSRPVIIRGDLTLSQARAQARESNNKPLIDEGPRTWYDIFEGVIR